MTWTSIRTKRVRFSTRQRQVIDRFVRRAFHRELQNINSVVVTLGPAKSGGGSGFTCRIRIWSHFLGMISVTDVGETLRTAVQQACWKARTTLRRRLHKRHDSARRISARRTSRTDFPDFDARFL